MSCRGMGVIGPRVRLSVVQSCAHDAAQLASQDLFISVYLTRPVVPIWGQALVQHNINVFDVGRALVQCEHKLRTEPEKVAGQSYLITGKSAAWSFRVSLATAGLDWLRVRSASG